MLRRKLLLTLLALALLLAMPSVVWAGDIVVDQDYIGLQPVFLPVFLDPDVIRNYSLMSYLGAFATLVFFAVMVLWFILIVRAALQIVAGQGNDDALASGKKKVTNVLVSVSLVFVFMIGLILIASFLGVGPFWEWPKAFSECSTSSKAKYYFQYALLPENVDLSDEALDRGCFGN